MYFKMQTLKSKRFLVLYFYDSQTSSNRRDNENEQLWSCVVDDCVNEKQMNTSNVILIYDIFDKFCVQYVSLFHSFGSDVFFEII